MLKLMFSVAWVFWGNCFVFLSIWFKRYNYLNFAVLTLYNLPPFLNVKKIQIVVDQCVSWIYTLAFYCLLNRSYIIYKKVYAWLNLRQTDINRTICITEEVYHIKNQLLHRNRRWSCHNNYYRIKPLVLS